MLMCSLNNKGCALFAHILPLNNIWTPSLLKKDVLDAVKMAQVACNGVVEVSLWFTSLMWTSCIIQSASSYESVTDAH